jgi:ABC-type dipeptide/oligopeptide/nickel transport system permease subunit
VSNVKKRWVFDTEDLPRLLRESTQYKGESLWQDAWRRLRRIRSAWWSLIFLVLFGATALFAPFLPIPSPTAFTLAGVPQPPIWASWAQERPEDWQTALEKLDAGNQPTATKLFDSFDNGWRHRSVIHFEVPEGKADAYANELSQWVESHTSRSSSIQTRPMESGAVAVQIAVPYNRSDRSQIFEIETGRSGLITLSLVTMDAEAGIRSAYFDCELPLDATRLQSWNSSATGKVRSVDFTTDGTAQGTGKLSYSVQQPHNENWVVVGVRVNGVEVAPTTQASERITTLSEQRAADPQAAALPQDYQPPSSWQPEEWNDPTNDIRVALDAGEHESVLFERKRVRAQEKRGTETLDLFGILSPLAESSMPTGAVLTAVKGYDQYQWDTGEEPSLSWANPGEWMRNFDRLLLTLRGRCFGLWQCSNWLGTDSGGRDLFARIIWGSRTSILVALAATLCSLIIGVTYGAFSGLMGGRIDNLMMRFVDIMYSVPFIFVVIFLITIVGEYRSELEDQYGIDREVVFFVVIGAIYWLTMARVVRGQVLSLKNSEFVEAARVVGASTSRILFSHLVPNVLSIVIVYLTLTIPAVMLFEAFLSFLGLGIEPPKVSWGLLASDSTEAISSVRTYWWLVAFPALAMGASLLALNILGDGLRDALDPKLRGKD